MKNDFKQTVNLRKAKKSVELTPHHKNQSKPDLSSTSRIGQIDRVYNGEDSSKENLQKINQPQPKQVNEGLIKRIVIISAVIITGVIICWTFFNNKSAEPDKEIGWYLIKLVDGKVYYGQVGDLSADPVEIKNVYYDYDQVKGEKEEIYETENIRLVKRGKETHGPTGTMYIVRDQIVHFEELGNNSKVLQAILAHE